MSWNAQGDGDADAEPPAPSDHGGSGFSGRSRVLYWADGFSEIAFVVPCDAAASAAAASSDADAVQGCASFVFHG